MSLGGDVAPQPSPAGAGSQDPPTFTAPRERLRTALAAVLKRERPDRLSVRASLLRSLAMTTETGTDQHRTRLANELAAHELHTLDVALQRAALFVVDAREYAELLALRDGAAAALPCQQPAREAT